MEYYKTYTIQLFRRYWHNSHVQSIAHYLLRVVVVIDTIHALVQQQTPETLIRIDELLG